MAADIRGISDETSSLLRPLENELLNGTLAHNAVGVGAEACLARGIEHVAQARPPAIQEILGFSRAVQAAR